MPVSRDTISRWVKTVLVLAGIDTSQYTAHSTRAASVSLLASRSLASTEDIVSSVGWSNEGVFQCFYNNPIKEDFNFGDQIFRTADKGHEM